MLKAHALKAQELRTRLRKIRRDAGLTQTELAARLKKPQSFVSKYEKGDRQLNTIELLEVLDALKVNASKFISELKSTW